ncbi:hypothetical protein RD1_1482 [Roseobacter denitrificans OCh 114]|uniref:Uncharacterized protein n=1 Tax=Roseobacter denitrificans (strain ATCC 33942 / OCh 114) TaxID=375451 RepID=Q16A78_ROSDO|nr:hypothetical protein RD1_1482 [Roseobacter denitrificans OCh 114]
MTPDGSRDPMLRKTGRRGGTMAYLTQTDVCPAGRAAIPIIAQPFNVDIGPWMN